ncbi:MAG: transcriptional regulator of arginine metabolism [Chlamydiales bacterium]|jgi:transcriptional regulator of arginine metabolism
MSHKNFVQERQSALSDLISKEAVGDQKALVRLLDENYGIHTNQAVISRDLRSLGIVKRQINDQMVYELPKTDVSTEILKLAIVDIRHNETTIVVKTHPGLADFVGDCIDECFDTEILGCIAGENVVLITPESIKEIKKTFKVVCEKLHFQV